MILTFKTIKQQILINKFRFIIVILIVFLSSYSELIAKTKKEKVFSKVGSLIFNFDFDSFIQLSSKKKSNSVTKVIPQFFLKFQYSHFSKYFKLLEGGNSIDSIPENLYSYQLYKNDKKIYENSFLISNGRKTKIDLKVLGKDHRFIDEKYIFLQKSSGYNITQDISYSYNNWSKKVKSDGSLEFYYNGIVTILKEDTQSTRFDFDNDGISDFEDNDDDNDSILDKNDDDDDNDGIRDDIDFNDQDNDNDGILNENEVRDNLLGKFQNPIITDFKVINLSKPSLGLYSKLGDLIQLEVEVNEGGGALVHEVDLQIYKKGKKSLSFKLYDDGSLLDINSNWEGKQITGDLKKGDGVFTYLLPLDLSMWELLYNSTWAINAKNIIGKSSNTFLFSSKNPIGQFKPNGKSNILSKIEKINLEYLTDSSETKIVKASINIDLNESCKVQMYHDNKKYFLYPEKKSLQEYHYFDNLTVHQGSIFILTIFDASGGIFYIGDRF